MSATNLFYEISSFSGHFLTDNKKPAESPRWACRNGRKRCNGSGAELLGKKKEGIPLKTWETQGDVGGFDEGRDAVAYLKPVSCTERVVITAAISPMRVSTMISLSTLSEIISFTMPGISLRIDCCIKSIHLLRRIDCATRTYLS